MEDTALGSLQSQPSAYCVTLGRGRPSLDLESVSVRGDAMACSSLPGLHEVCIRSSLLLFLGGREGEEATAFEFTAIQMTPVLLASSAHCGARCPSLVC